METVLGTTLGVLFGGVITWYFSWKYYEKAGNELLTESKKLKQTSDLILYKLQYPDAKTQLIRNERGDVTGLTVDMEVKM